MDIIIKLLSHTYARLCVVRQPSHRSEEAVDAGVAVDAVCEPLALLADPTAFVVAVDVEREALLVHVRVIVALV